MRTCTYSLFFQAEDVIRDFHVTGVQTCALPISTSRNSESTTESSSDFIGDARISREEALKSDISVPCQDLEEAAVRECGRTRAVDRGYAVQPFLELDLPRALSRRTPFDDRVVASPELDLALEAGGKHDRDLPARALGGIHLRRAQEDGATGLDEDLRMLLILGQLLDCFAHVDRDRLRSDSAEFRIDGSCPAEPLEQRLRKVATLVIRIVGSHRLKGELRDAGRVADHFGDAAVGPCAKIERRQRARRRTRRSFAASVRKHDELSKDAATFVPLAVARELDALAEDIALGIRHQHRALAGRGSDAVSRRIEVKPRAIPVVRALRDVVTHLLIDLPQRDVDLAALRPRTGGAGKTLLLQRCRRQENDVLLGELPAVRRDQPVAESLCVGPGVRKVADSRISVDSDDDRVMKIVHDYPSPSGNTTKRSLTGSTAPPPTTVNR